MHSGRALWKQPQWLFLDANQSQTMYRCQPYGKIRGNIHGHALA